VDATFDYISAHRDEYEPGRIDKAVIAATREAISGWIDLLGSAGRA
jgi:hypothetical protein